MELVWSTVHVGSIRHAEWETRAVSLRVGLYLHERMTQSLREKNKQLERRHGSPGQCT